MACSEIAGIDAWTSLVRAHESRWSHDVERFRESVVRVAHQPKFTISRSDVFFCLGSCFARNVEEHLIYAGVRVLSRRIRAPKEEWPYRINGFVGKFTTHSMTNEIEWTCDRPAIDESLFEEGEHGWCDLQLAPGIHPVTLERAIERRAYLIDDYFNRLRDADVVVLTLGLNEVWKDLRSGRYLNAAPSFYSVRKDRARYIVEVTDAAQNVDQLEKLSALLRRLNPNVRIIVTVSPVPMGETFTGKDVAVANMHSKATLRVAAEAFCRSHENVDYFPSFEMVSLSPRASAYGQDCLHVADSAVRTVIGEFLRLYVGAEIVSSPFNEMAYLAANPDVEEAARRGEIESGFWHWNRFGQSEGRLLTPADGPTPLMIAAGAV